MTYKEIQVPNETVRAVYEKFYAEVELLVPVEAERNRQQHEINSEFIRKEKEFRDEYYKLIGKGCYYEYGIDYHMMWSREYTPALDAMRETQTMLDALKYSEGNLTMTQDQVNRMDSISNGEVIKSIQRYINKPLYRPKSEYESRLKAAQEMHMNKMSASEVKKMTDQKQVRVEPSGSFGGALFGILLIAGLVCVMLKACS